MDTEVLPATAYAIAKAAAILRRGGLVAFPTETVYGLGANALDARAVAGIFTAKGRPSQNPLIVHVASAAHAADLAGAWPETARRLAKRFWPGPLTVVVPTSAQISDLVTAGGPTVALRVPAHPVAQELLQAAALPLAAPSANRSSSLSPTRAEHVHAGLQGRVPLILDAGPTPGGLESTVLDLTASPPRLLRPGLVTPAAIEAMIGPIERQATTKPGLPPRSPGMLDRHYSPQTPLECTTDDGWQCVRLLLGQGMRVGWMTPHEAPQPLEPAHGVVLVMPAEPAQYAAQLYTALHTLDLASLDRIVVALPPQGEEWLAVHDRLRRAAHQ